MWINLKYKADLTTMDADKSLSIAGLKILLSQQLNIRKELLIIGVGRIIEPDTKTLEECGVAENDTITVVDLAECAVCGRTQAEVGLSRLNGSNRILCDACRQASPSETANVRRNVRNFM